jgi:peptidoglycan lytic transglycosylase
MIGRHTGILAVIAAAALLSGCGRNRAARVDVPPAPPAHEAPASPAPETPPPAAQPSPQPVYVETGLASWYGPPYHNRRSSNGEIYNMHAFTAAHRTLPLGTRVRVTNLQTGRSTMVRITDRGPFIRGRILDLSLAAAEAIDVRHAGVARVKVEVVEAPAPIDNGGRWAVQIGAFAEQDAARRLVDRLSRRYQTAHVREFSSPVGDWWVRVRVLKDDKLRAQEVARDTHTSEGGIFLVRLD